MQSQEQRSGSKFHLKSAAIDQLIFCWYWKGNFISSDLDLVYNWESDPDPFFLKGRIWIRGFQIFFLGGVQMPLKKDRFFCGFPYANLYTPVDFVEVVESTVETVGSRHYHCIREAFFHFAWLCPYVWTIEEEIRKEQKRSYFFRHFSIWDLWPQINPHIDAATCYEPY